jgi:hypothetical protein
VFQQDIDVGRLPAARPVGGYQLEMRDGDRQPPVGARRRLMGEQFRDR